MNSVLKKIINYMTPFQWFEVIGCLAFTIYFAILDIKEPNPENQHALWYIIVSSISSVCGIFCVVLCAAGKLSQFYWGIVQIVAYVVVSWVSKLYGEVMLNAIYYFPCQFIGLYFWLKNKNNDNGKVQARKMKLWLEIILVCVCVLFTWLYQILLSRLGGNSTWLDSASTIVSVVANALMVLRFSEQWILWIIVDVITVIMWAIQKDFIQTTMWAFFLMNAVYGLVVWMKMSKTK